MQAIKRAIILAGLLTLNMLSQAQAEEYRYQGIGHSLFMKVVVDDDGCT